MKGQTCPMIGYPVRLSSFMDMIDKILPNYFQIFGSLFAMGYPPIQILLIGAYIVSSYFAIVEKQFGRVGQVETF
jgi:hypothetical protein